MSIRPTIVSSTTAKTCWAYPYWPFRDSRVGVSCSDRHEEHPVCPGLPSAQQRKIRRRPLGSLVLRVRTLDPKDAWLREHLQSGPSGWILRAGAPAGKTRLGFSHFSPRSLRRCFMTRAIELGIDFKTIASWQGHRDGGVLIAKTYSHLRNEHSDNMAKKLVM